MSTSYNETYGKHWVTLIGRNRMVFRIKACHSSRMLLVAIPGNTVRLATEIVLGKDGKYVRLSMNTF